VSTYVVSAQSDWASEFDTLVADLRNQTLVVNLSVLVAVGVGTLAMLAVYPGPPVRIAALALYWLLLTGAATLFRRRNYAISAWLLVTGVFAGVLLLTAWLAFPAGIFLLVAPIGLATVLVSRWAGTGLALAATVLLAFAPYGSLPLDASLRVLSASSNWILVGLLAITLRPLIEAVRWAQDGYERSHKLLVESQDHQLEMSELLQDLAAANQQLTRLNQQAHALRQAAEEAQRSKMQFTANVSHELRTPLNMITAFCEMIVDAPEHYGDEVPRALLADLQVVLRNSQHLTCLVNDVLDLSQMDAGQMTLSKEPVVVDELVEAAIIAVRPLYEAKGLWLEWEIEPDLPEVRCDRTRIREVLLNLLSNAGRFTEAGGVSVRVYRKAHDVLFSVRDTGPGIDSAQQDRLFQPYHQADGTIRRRYGGTGLGLSISRNFIQLHGGDLWIESELDRGAQFTFRLPLDIEPPMQGATRWVKPFAQHDPRSRPSRLSPVALRPRVLVIDEGIGLARLVGRFLPGADVEATASIEVALATLAANPAQAIIANTPVPDQLMNRVKGSLPPGVMLLACSIPSGEVDSQALGLSDYLVKPVQPAALRAALGRLPRPPRTVLVVDDDGEMQQLYRRMLSAGSEELSVLRAENGLQALDILAFTQPDVILLDMVMPEMDGFAFLGAKNRNPAWASIPVIMISARDPSGQPIVSSSLTVTRHDGLSAQQLLACITALLAVFSPEGFQTCLNSPVAPPG
jgi:signal transduction histidine kinase/DNA-binding response OmpR family regulator